MSFEAPNSPLNNAASSAAAQPRFASTSVTGAYRIAVVTFSRSSRSISEPSSLVGQDVATELIRPEVVVERCRLRRWKHLGEELSGAISGAKTAARSRRWR